MVKFDKLSNYEYLYHQKLIIIKESTLEGTNKK